MKEIFITQEHPANHLLGKFLDESHYDILIEEDCDVYGPLSSLDKENGEHNLILKFRKNVFNPEECRVTYEGLREAAQESQNRGIAAGPRIENSTGREWVTALQEEVLDRLSGSMTTVFGDEEDVLGAIYKKHETNPVAGTKGNVWLTLKRPTDFNFNEWARATEKLSLKEREAEVEKVSSWISDTSYANPVYSGIAGNFDRYPRIPYCRTTTYSTNNKEKFDLAIPFIEKISEKFSKLVPGRYAAQAAAMSKLDPAFRVGNSVYTTITVNKSYRTAAHRDAGDLTEGFGNLAVVSNGVPWKGCYTVFPAYRAAVNVQPGDLIMMNVHEIHGNTPISSESGDHERISIVCYMREKMQECGTKSYEDTRYRFIEERRLNKNHPDWREKWNGISPGVWATEEWAMYLANNGFTDEAEEIVKKLKPTALDI